MAAASAPNVARNAAADPAIILGSHSTTLVSDLTLKNKSAFKPDTNNASAQAIADIA
jgi:hypothetical protein